jgi:hypothetical protein
VDQAAVLHVQVGGSFALLVRMRRKSVMKHVRLSSTRCPFLRACDWFTFLLFMLVVCAFGMAMDEYSATPRIFGVVFLIIVLLCRFSEAVEGSYRDIEAVEGSYRDIETNDRKVL